MLECETREQMWCCNSVSYLLCQKIFVTYAEHPKRDMTKFKVENSKKYAVFGDFCPNSIFF